MPRPLTLPAEFSRGYIQAVDDALGLHEDDTGLVRSCRHNVQDARVRMRHRPLPVRFVQSAAPDLHFTLAEEDQLVLAIAFDVGAPQAHEAGVKPPLAYLGRIAVVAAVAKSRKRRWRNPFQILQEFAL